jgi:hypothetical protein
MTRAASASFYAVPVRRDGQVVGYRAVRSAGGPLRWVAPQRSTYAAANEDARVASLAAVAVPA